MRIHVLNGPNLRRLGKRQPEIYGSISYDDLVERLHALGHTLGIPVVVRQTDSESELIGWIHDIADNPEPVVLNAAALTHTSVAVRDACAELTDGWGFLEVHISNIYARENFRRQSYLSDLAIGTISGLGIAGYDAAVRWFYDERIKNSSLSN